MSVLDRAGYPELIFFSTVLVAIVCWGTMRALIDLLVASGAIKRNQSWRLSSIMSDELRPFRVYR